MTDKAVKPDLMSRFHDQGADLAHRAEGGHLTEVIKELDTLRKQLGKGEYDALMKNIQGVNIVDVLQDRQDVAAANKKHWFGIGDTKPTLPTLIFDDPEKNGIPNKLVGSILADGQQNTQLQEAKQPETKAPAKPNNGETVLMC